MLTHGLNGDPLGGFVDLVGTGVDGVCTVEGNIVVTGVVNCVVVTSSDT